MSEAILYEVRDGIAYVTLNRPEVRNAINGEMCDGLREAWVEVEADPAVRVVILAANGDHFSVGKDLKEKDDPSKPHRLHMAYPPNGTALFKPLIGAVQGYVLGGAYSFAVRGCDLTIAADDMILGFPEAKAGISIPPIGYVPYLPFKVSLEFMLLAWKGANFMDAERAYQLGLVNRVVPRDDLMEEAVRWAENLKEVPPLYVRSIKYGHYKSAQLRYLENEQDYVNYIWPQIVSEDRQEALEAFRGGRRPEFKGR
jgi:enoyl-CoA hydratase/carnithine racemase